MPKIRPTTLFARRNLVILLLDGKRSNGTESKLVFNAGMLVQPIVDIFKSQAPKTEFDIIHMSDTHGITDRGVGSLSTPLNIVYQISMAKKPTVIVAPDIFDESYGDKDNEMIATYIKLLVTATGGFVVRVGDGVEPAFTSNVSLPEIDFNCMSQSWMDIEFKVASIAKRLLTPASINYYTMMNILGAAATHSGIGSVCLGDISRMHIDETNDENSLRTIINVAGDPDSPISLSEFSHRVWCNPKITKEQLDPSRTLVLRDPSAFARLAVSKLLTSGPAVANKTPASIKMINIAQ